VNSVRCQSQDRFVDEGYKRGMLYIYKWLALDQDPTVWITTDNSASCYRGDMGNTMAIAGSSSNCTILVSAINSSNGNVRLLTQKFYDGAVVNTYYTERNSSATHPFSTALAGENFRLTLSPLDETHLGDNGLIVNANNFVWDGSLINPHEITLAASTTNSADVADVSTDLVDPASNGISFFRYLDRAMMVVPTIADDMATGVTVLDVTDGFASATPVTTLGTTLAEPIAAEGLTLNTGAKVNGEKLDLYLMVGGEMIRFTQDASQGKQGDLTGDGAVDVSDVNLLINIILGKKTAADCVGNPNLNGDSKVDVSDVNLLINIILGKQ
ncbi:MAG: dockerin type I repeat-containing protein, partial [Muribaculaceae bacterium]|nr:dockerin type I repeat-containing protein [Muribaculaceae bacterium]